MPTVVSKMANGSLSACHGESWKILAFHGEYCKMLARVYIALANGDTDAANAELDSMIETLSYHESDMHPYFDLVLFVQRTRQLIEGK